MKTLKPIRDFNSYSKPIAQAIFAQLDEMIYAPLRAILSQKENLNVKVSALVDALSRGVLEYRDGYFVGSLNSRLSRDIRSLGGKWNGVRKVYYLDIARMPQEVLQAIAAGNQASQSILKQVNQSLYAMEGREIKAPNIEPLFSDIIAKLNKQFYFTTKKVTSADIEIPFNPKFEEDLKEAYTVNLDKYIKGWHDEAILRLRKKVSDNAQEGYRASNLIDIIQAERQVSKNKATFLAKQETSLLTASYREIRYKDVGVTRYTWSTSHDERVREDHRILNGHIFEFDHPPVSNQKTGARNNPGQDFGCRCTAIPILNGINFYDEEPISTQKILEEAK